MSNADNDKLPILPRSMASSQSEGVLQMQRSCSEMRMPTFRDRAPRTRDEWQSSTQGTLRRVEALTRDVFDNVYRNQAAEVAARKAMQEHAKKEREKQRVKVHARSKQHEGFIKATMKCMREIEHAVTQVEGAQGRMTAERYTRYADSKVCEYRMDLRSKRPGPELYRDPVQKILEKELQLLNSARKELLHEEGECRNVLVELKAILDEMAKDIGNRRMAMSKDVSTINAGADVPLHNPDCISDAGSRSLAQRGYELSAMGLRLNEHSDDVIKRIKSECSVVSKRVGQTLAQHVKELANMRAQLARQVVDSEGAVDKAEAQLGRMLPRIEMGDATLQDTANKMQALLRDLRATRSKTTEDLRNKTTALEIDNSCRKVTAQMASEAKPKKRVTMANSSSAPTLGSPNMASTTGNFNVTFLKESPYQSPTFSKTSFETPSATFFKDNPGNPQQGDCVPEVQPPDQFRHTAIGLSREILSKCYQDTASMEMRMSSTTGFTNRSGGSSPLKAAARGFVQGQPPE